MKPTVRASRFVRRFSSVELKFSRMHDDEILGKAYDAVLMRRLLVYLRPYWRQVLVAFVAILVGAGAALAQPYLFKVAIDRYIAEGRLEGLGTLAALYLGDSGRRVRRRVHPDLDDAADRPADHVRPADGDLRPPAAARPPLLRSQSGRPADDARDLGRRRPERPLHLGRRHDLRRRLHARRHHGRDAVDGLAAGAGGVLRAAADRAGHAVVPPERPRVLPRGPRTGSRGSTRSCRKTSPACRPCSCSAASASTSSASTRSTAGTATRTSTRSSTTRCSIRRSRRSPRWRQR